MKICYIPPKGKKKEIRLYNILYSLLWGAFADPQVRLIFCICIILAGIAATNQIIISNKKHKKDQIDEQLKLHDRQKKIDQMYEDQRGVQKTKNVNTDKLF